MIIAEIGRGLGNSMFVYATAKALAEHHKTELKVDTTYLRSWPRWEKYGGAWEFELGKFNISAKEATKEELKKFDFKTKFRPLDKIFRRYKLFEKNVHYFPSDRDINKFFELPDNIYLWGYFGSEKFFKEIKTIIQKEFTLKEENKEKIKSLLQEIAECNAVSLHVRRGDVLKLKDAYILPLDFYKEAISLIKEKVKEPIFYVFSDEIEWCKNNFKDFDIKMRFVEGNSGWEDLELMKTCKHNILAVSALSWWAGYLNSNLKKIVIAPEHFSHFRKALVESNLLEEWIKIKDPSFLS